jgi:hypothetical protein
MQTSVTLLLVLYKKPLRLVLKVCEMEDHEIMNRYVFLYPTSEDALETLSFCAPFASAVLTYHLILLQLQSFPRLDPEFPTNRTPGLSVDISNINIRRS